MALNLLAAFAAKEAQRLASDEVSFQDIASPCLDLFDNLADLWMTAGIREFVRKAYMFRDEKPAVKESAVDADEHASVLVLEGLGWVPDIECECLN